MSTEPSSRPVFSQQRILSPLFTRVRGETVRKVPEVSTTQPYRLSKQLISDHFGLRIPAKATLRASIAPFSDSLGRVILRSSSNGISRKFRIASALRFAPPRYKELQVRLQRRILSMKDATEFNELKC